MADYDVGALALVVPATSGPKATYRPAVSVRNNGIHDALASGFLRIYSAGLLVFESEIYSATLAPGASGNAETVTYWTPTAEGNYEVHAYITCPLDQVEQNNMLGPVTITITGEEPPEPTTVPAHAAQHEEDGSDELSIDGLKGRAADPQDALAHATSHQAGGADALNVGSLQGILAQDQPAQVHGNTRHNPDMATEAELVAHQDAVAAHQSATNLEHTANKGVANGYAGLDANALVPDDQIPLSTPVPTYPGWTSGLGASPSVPRADHLHASPGVLTDEPAYLDINDANEHDLIRQTILAAGLSAGSLLRLRASGSFTFPGAAPSVVFRAYAPNFPYAITVVPLPALSNKAWSIEADIIVISTAAGNNRCTFRTFLDATAAAIPVQVISTNTAHTWTPGVNFDIALTAQMLAPAAADHLFRWIAYCELVRL